MHRWRLIGRQLSTGYRRCGTLWTITVLLYGAADAAAGYIDLVFITAHNQIAFDIDFTEIIDQNGNLSALIMPDNVVEQSGLSGTEKSAQNRHLDSFRKP